MASSHTAATLASASGLRKPGRSYSRQSQTARSWQHINLLGEYDFSDEKLQDSVGIKPQKLAA
jgi:hypothetical protein